MAEVIEITSSSPPCSPHREKEPDLKANNPAHSGSLSDFFDETGSIDFQIDRPTKKQRTSRSQQGKQLLPEPVVYDFASDDESPMRSGSNVIAENSRASRVSTNALNTFDDVILSSSAPELGQTNKAPAIKRWDFSDDSLQNDPQQALTTYSPDHDADQPERREYSSRTAQLLAALPQDVLRVKKVASHSTKAVAVSKPTKAKTRTKSVDDIVWSSSPATALSGKISIPPAVEKAKKAGARSTAKADRDAERELEREQKRQARERKAKEKQQAADLAEVNKASRRNKNNSAPEMIVDMTSSLQNTSIGNQVQEYMKQADIELHYVDEEFDMTDAGSEKNYCGNTVTWRRKVASAYNAEDGQWEPTSKTRLERENHVLIHLPAADFAATLATSRPSSSHARTPTEEEMQANLDAHVSCIRRRHQACIPIYLLEGMNAWLKKNANSKNRQYAAAVRAQMVEPQRDSTNLIVASSQANSRKRKKPATPTVDLSFVTAEHVENLLLYLQVAHQPIFIQHTSSPATSASQILALTQHLSIRPYRLAQLDYNLKNASFCMESGQVKTGDNAKETFAKMLQEVQRVTPSMAYGILDGWNSVRKLVVGFDKHGNHMLEDVKKSLNRDGVWSDRRLGPQVSKRLYKVFMGRDPSATDGMS